MALDLVDYNKLLTTPTFSFIATTELDLHKNIVNKKEGYIYYTVDTNKTFIYHEGVYIDLGLFYEDNDYNKIEEPQKKRNRKIIRTTCQFCGAKLKIFGDEDTCKCEWCDQVNVVVGYE